ncbi:hypothetical protein LIS77_05235 [Cytobacillus firmus]|uniref:hypothetical protein n=1 Tax=Cytobacillus firmus TaxID=1399 RepID=UPI00207A2AD5|nr:hypothetical protein [Cytobacillus firmus]USK39932.1 hypothetical protein LIS77_05235 [Cytobacillus firmus]
MIDFKELLVLKYLNDYEDEYTFLEIKQLCNFSTKQLKICLKIMHDKKLLIYENNELRILSAGRVILKENKLLDIHFDELFSDKVTLQFIDSPLNIGDIYIPKDFKK